MTNSFQMLFLQYFKIALLFVASFGLTNPKLLSYKIKRYNQLLCEVWGMEFVIFREKTFF